MSSIFHSDCDNTKSFTTLFIIMTLIVMGNILTLASPIGLVITIPQYVYVLSLIVQKDLKKAYLAHMAFVLLSSSVQGAAGMFGTQDFLLYNYGTLKVIGPIRAFYLVNILFVILFSHRAPVKHSLLYKLYRTFLIIFTTGTIIGAIGCLLIPYYSFDALVNNLIYVFVVLSTLYVLVRMVDSDSIKNAYYIGVCAIMAATDGSFLCYKLFHVTTNYSIFELPYQVDLAYFMPLLLIGYYSIKHRFFYWLSLISFLIMSMGGLGGKSVYAIGFCLACLAYLTFLDKDTSRAISRKNIYVKPLLILISVVSVIFVIDHASSDSMVSYKFQSALSMFSGDISEISRSPYIRIASLINVIHEGLSNPFILLFGNGYGGYFMDGLNLFAGLDLSNGAWGDVDIQSGHFHSGHDTMVTVPFFNGMVGLYLIIRISWMYIKRIKCNFLCGVAFVWIILMFYFNTLYAAFGVFLLFAAEYNVSYGCRLNVSTKN